MTAPGSSRRDAEHGRRPAVVLAAVSPHPAPAGSDRPPLARLLADAGIAGPTKPFGSLSFLMPDLAGGTVDLDGLRGRVVLLGAR